MNAIRLYGRYIGVSLRSQMQYPGSFLLTSIGAFVAPGIDFIAVWALFSRFRQIQGCHFGEVGLFYGVIGGAVAVADRRARAVRRFMGTSSSRAIRAGRRGRRPPRSTGGSR